HLQAIVRNGPTAVQVDRVIFSNQQQGAELVGTDRHLGDSVEVLTDEVTAFSTTPVRLVRQAIVRYKGGVRLVWYWYRVAGVGTTQSMKAKLLEIPAGIIGSSPSEFVAVSTPCGPRDCADAARALRAVLTRP
ncbi:exosortase C-terminal domain/associated protein EpsI, partial [Gemmatimonas sp.]